MNDSSPPIEIENKHSYPVPEEKFRRNSLKEMTMKSNKMTKILAGF